MYSLSPSLCLSAQCDWAAECGAVRAEQPLEFMPEGVDFLAARAKMAVVAPLILAGVAPARVLRGGAPAERTVQVQFMRSHSERGTCLQKVWQFAPASPCDLCLTVYLYLCVCFSRMECIVCRPF